MKTIAVAESCTGGLISSRITDVPGSSKYFLLGVVVYANQFKQSLLDVPENLLRQYGAVSRQVALKMAQGIRQLAGTDIGLGVTGIAGPGGGTKKKPVGLVYIALSTKTRTICKKFRFSGDRFSIKWQAAQATLNMLKCAHS